MLLTIGLVFLGLRDYASHRFVVCEGWSPRHFWRPSSLLKWKNICLLSNVSLQNLVSVSKIFRSLRRKSHCLHLFLMDAEEVEDSLQLELIKMQCDYSLKNWHQLLSLLLRSVEQNESLRLNIHMWAVILSVNSEQKYVENQKHLQPALWCPSQLNHETYSWLGSYPSEAKCSITAPTEHNTFSIAGELKIYTDFMCL